MEKETPRDFKQKNDEASKIRYWDSRKKYARISDNTKAAI